MSNNKGLHAKTPLHIPLSGWKEIFIRVKDKMDIKNIPVMAAGVAYYFFMSLFPALLAIVTLYTIVTDPLLVREHLEKLSPFMPREVHEFIFDKIMNIVNAAESSKNWGLALSFIVGLGSANKGTMFLFRAINEIYNEKNKRNMIKQNAITLAFTLGLMLIGILSLFMIVAYPIINEYLDLNGHIDSTIKFSRWIVLALIFLICIALIFQFAPQRKHPRFKWVSPGAVIATVLWILGSLILTIYVQNFDKIEDLYGQISALIILMIWLNITSFVILLGAQVNAELEHQTSEDTTNGEDKPKGERKAYFADHVAAKEENKQ
ncbi:YihY/virulence factor BrkB family protein [Anditalea andensis]|uniref:Uncharacterized protein n=1 Tax=Anditalea andensis TaxID=1048983 RepID=A0A074L119_9BACT|nr:YihY/virulence factor BrkB family protein [Anditalea andensis]KEO74859.1 hypothetical protein EL17_04050 [Anditalea andensis]